ncbi:ABC transporter ATP-binding protein [Catenulispora rubra]|uniref:ABC transporter ATP-binding protein n=1 Tax=Catenulispora rubra TaxID=280293 RepID=UPI001E5428B5|nr:ATP-binding cassette domain-containing protein [Catenulispora rubra]
MIRAVGLTKRYGDKVAVDHADFTVEAGTVTGFLGPNGAGKSTTMRMVLGLDRPTDGSVTVDGKPYRNLPVPLREVGALLDAKSVHGGRTAYNHLACLAKSNGIPLRRVDEVIGLVGLEQVAKKRSKNFSLGMGQRLGIAAALLGDPGTLLFDEPVNGLDPEGILWVRNLMKSLAAQGRTVFVSSHLMSEMALTADRVIVIGRGEIKADTTMREFIAQNATTHVRVRSPHIGKLRELMVGQGWRTEALPDDDGAVEVFDVASESVGDLAGQNGLWLHELAVVQPSLEEAFMSMTADSVEYHAGVPGMEPGQVLGQPGMGQPSQGRPSQGQGRSPSPSSDPDQFRSSAADSGEARR